MADTPMIPQGGQSQPGEPEKFLWNIGTSDSPIIQGQAGKPFYHEDGGCIKLPYSDLVTENHCLCNYPYMQYFWIYAKLVHKDSIQFLDLQAMLHNYEVNRGALSDSLWPVNTISDSGWEWELVQWSDSSYYRYAGCHANKNLPKQVGRWYPALDDNRYYQTKQVDGRAKLYVPGKLTYPSRSHVYRYQGSYNDPQLGFVYYRYRYNTGPASVMRMLVCSYQPCNGRLGRGQIKSCSDAVDVAEQRRYQLYYMQPNLNRLSYYPDYEYYPLVCTPYGRWLTASANKPWYAALDGKKGLLGQRVQDIFSFQYISSSFIYRPAVVGLPIICAVKYQIGSDSISYPTVPSDSQSIWFQYDLCQQQQFTHFRKQSDSLIWPCNLPQPPQYKYRNIKSSDSDQFNSVRYIPLNVYRGRYAGYHYNLSGEFVTESDCCSGYKYSFRSDSILIQGVYDTQVLPYIQKADSNMPLMQDGNAYKYLVQTFYKYQKFSSPLNVTQDLNCPVYFAKFIDMGGPCSDSGFLSDSANIDYHRPCSYGDWIPLGYQPQRNLNGNSLGVWSVYNLNSWSTTTSLYRFGTPYRVLKYIVKKPMYTQCVHSSDSAQPTFDRIILQSLNAKLLPQVSLQEIYNGLPQGWCTDIVTHTQQTVLCINFYCDLDADDWDDTALWDYNSTDQQRNSCLNNRDKGGSGTAQNPWRNLSWALWLLQSAVAKTTVQIGRCKPHLVLNCTGKAHYCAAAFGDTIKERQTNGVNLVIKNMNLDITRSTRVLYQYVILQATYASLYHCNIRNTFVQESSTGTLLKLFPGPIKYGAQGTYGVTPLQFDTYGCIAYSNINFIDISTTQVIFAYSTYASTLSISRNQPTVRTIIYISILYETTLNLYDIGFFQPGIDCVVLSTINCSNTSFNNSLNTIQFFFYMYMSDVYMQSSLVEGNGYTEDLQIQIGYCIDSQITMTFNSSNSAKHTDILLSTSTRYLDVCFLLGCTVTLAGQYSNVQVDVGIYDSTVNIQQQGGNRYIRGCSSFCIDSDVYIKCPDAGSQDIQTYASDIVGANADYVRGSTIKVEGSGFRCWGVSSCYEKLEDCQITMAISNGQYVSDIYLYGAETGDIYASNVHISCTGKFTAQSALIHADSGRANVVGLRIYSSQPKYSGTISVSATAYAYPNELDGCTRYQYQYQYQVDVVYGQPVGYRRRFLHCRTTEGGGCNCQQDTD